MSDNFRTVYEWARTKDEAKAAAKSQAKRIERAKKAVELAMPGSLDMVAGAVVSLSGFRQGIDGKYKIVSVTHSVTRSGWTTRISAEGA
jgi:phage protein D